MCRFQGEIEHPQIEYTQKNIQKTRRGFGNETETRPIRQSEYTSVSHQSQRHQQEEFVELHKRESEI